METLTFLFTDIEGSTVLLRRVGEGIYAQVLADHHRLIRSALAGRDGQEVATQGDGFFAVFSSPGACLAAVVEMQQALEAYAWPGGQPVRVRMGVHTGAASQTVSGLVGLDVHRAARVAAVAYGGQILLSGTTVALVRGSLPPGTALTDLGAHWLKDLGRPEEIFQLHAPGLQAGFPPLRSLGSPSAAAATRTLPRDVGSFTGREPELARLLADAGRRPGTGCGSTRSTGWRGSARRPSRCTPRTGWPRASRTGSSSFRCTPIPQASGRSTRPMRWRAC